MVFGWWQENLFDFQQSLCFGFLSKGSPMIQNNGNLSHPYSYLFLQWTMSFLAMWQTIHFLTPYFSCCTVTSHFTLGYCRDPNIAENISEYHFTVPWTCIAASNLRVRIVLRKKGKLDSKNPKKPYAISNSNCTSWADCLKLELNDSFLLPESWYLERTFQRSSEPIIKSCLGFCPTQLSVLPAA